jgi:probable rRNA maturation factor
MLNLEIVIRPKIKIKSRQWWISSYKKIYRLLNTYLPETKSKFLKRSTLCLLVTNNKEIQNLNKKFRKINKPTDVLSFHLDKNKQIKQKYLGDIVISIETARRDAHTKGISLDKELKMLLIHANLHLLGYDHITKKGGKIMFSLQEKILGKCC